VLFLHTLILTLGPLSDPLLTAHPRNSLSVMHLRLRQYRPRFGIDRHIYLWYSDEQSAVIGTAQS